MAPTTMRRSIDSSSPFILVICLSTPADDTMPTGRSFLPVICSLSDDTNARTKPTPTRRSIALLLVLLFCAQQPHANDTTKLPAAPMTRERVLLVLCGFEPTCGADDERTVCSPFVLRSVVPRPSNACLNDGVVSFQHHRYHQRQRMSKCSFSLCRFVPHGGR